MWNMQERMCEEKSQISKKAPINERKRMCGKNVILRTGYTRRGVLPAGISPMHFGRDVLLMMP